MDEQGLTSWADYRRAGDRLFIDHVEAPEALRGTGAAGRLMAALAADARAKALKHHPHLRLRRRLAAAEQGIRGPGGGKARGKRLNARGHRQARQDRQEREALQTS